MAGANISGNLKDPQVAIPRGTLTAIAASTAVYVLFAVLSAFTYVRDADGISNFTVNYVPNCSLNDTCPFGLHNYYQTIMVASGFSYLITAGIVAASLSSALGALTSAPRIFQ
ncbi:hypothetical protein GCK32_020620, partial [Trichostrongylus colubriformis]